jgi:hypothetical protein
MKLDSEPASLLQPASKTDNLRMSAVVSDERRSTGSILDDAQIERQSVNPFLSRTLKISACEWLKMILLLPLALLRILVILFVVVPLIILITGGTPHQPAGLTAVLQLLQCCVA